MAAFFANIQVQAEDRQAVIDAVIAQLGVAGFALDEEVYGGDRSVYVGPLDEGWVGIFNSAADGVHVGPLAWLAQALSARLAAVTMAWMVHDAVLLYLLFDRGEVVDRYLSHPTAFQPVDPERPTKPQPPIGGDGDLLLQVTGLPGDDRQLTRWLQRPAVFVQNTLERVAGVLNQRYADLGHSDIEAADLGEAELDRADDFVRLEFVSDTGAGIDDAR